MFEHWWLFEPFIAGDYRSVALWYAGCTAVMIVLALVGKYAGVEPESPFEDHWSLRKKLALAVVFAPIVEETLFRIIPAIAGAPLWLLIGLSVVWALLHRGKQLLIMPHVPLYVKMAASGMLLEAVLVHAVHNCWATLHEHYLEDG